MKKLILMFLVVMSICSCSNEQDNLAGANTDEVGSLKVTTNEDVITFQDRNDLLAAINADGNLSRATVARYDVGDKFVSLLDEITPSSECWNDFSKEEQDSILAEHLTYYDVEGYDELVPNEGFARLINWRGEILVNDSLYRITPVGTFRSGKNNSAEIDSLYNSLINSNDSVSFDGLDYIALSPNVVLYNSFDKIGFDNLDISTRSTSVPLRHFSSTESNGWVWKQVAKIFGDRSTKHYEFLHKKRVDGSLYDYNYGVYHESGAFVSASRKRGGFLRKINGWKSYKANQLEIVCENLVFKIDVKTPSAAVFPDNIKFISNSNYIKSPIGGQPIKTVDIIGREVNYRDVANAVKAGFKGLQSWVKKPIDKETKAVRFLSPNVLTTFILEDRVTAQNTDKLRKVFNSGVNFYISNKILKDPISISSVKNLFEGLRDIPVQHVDSGRVYLISQIDGQWGGIVIDKNYSAPLKNIIR